MESIEDAGFDGRLLGQGTEKGMARLHVDGMLCSACRCVMTWPFHLYAFVNTLSICVRQA